MAQAISTHSITSELTARINSFVSDLYTRWHQHAQYRRTLDELQSLSARELDDLGIGRSELMAIAHESAYGK